MEMPPRLILVPVDPSDASVAAWKRAMDLSERFGARVKGLFVQQLSYVVGGMGFGPTEAGLMIEPGPDALAELRTRLGPYAALEPATGFPPEEIRRHAREGGYDLIVMGTHGRRGLERFVLGSVAEEVALRSEVPVLVVRSETPNIRSILVGLGPGPETPETLETAARVAGAFKRHLRVVRAAGPGKAARARASAASLIAGLPRAVRQAARVELEVAEGDLGEALTGACGERDLLVLAAPARGRLLERIRGGLVERAIREASGSVLILPAPSRARGVLRRGGSRRSARRASRPSSIGGARAS